MQGVVYHLANFGIREDFGILKGVNGRTYMYKFLYVNSVYSFVCLHVQCINVHLYFLCPVNARPRLDYNRGTK